jgi:Tfp pilus assembly protein PilX
MKVLSNSSRLARSQAERGAALLLSLMILLILVAIVIQLNISTSTDARIGRNDVTMSAMDLAAESALLQCAEALKTDAEGDSSSAAAGAPGASGGAAAAAPTAGATTPAAGAGAPQQQSQPTDSSRDEWATPQRTEINQIKLRIITQDEDSKYNVLNMLAADEKEAEAAFDRVVRILDACREGTQYDIDPRTAEEMAKTMLEHMTKRRQSKLPRPKLLTDDEKNEDVGLPSSMREFLPLEPFEEVHFKDFRDQDQRVVHSITTFLTVWSSLATNPMTSESSVASAAKTGTNGKSTSSSSSSKGAASSSTAGKAGSTTPSAGSSGKSGTTGSSAGQPAGGAQASPSAAGAGAAGATDPNAAQSAGGAGASGAQSKAASTTGGFGVNVNTAPAAVLKSLFDSREVPGRFWDKVIEYRNAEDEEEKEKAKESAATSSSSSLEEEEQLDEYGQPIKKNQIFKSVQDLSKVDGWGDLPAEFQTKVTQMLTVQSEVFSVFVIARKSTAQEEDTGLGLTPAELRKREETRGDSLQRVIHAVYWRQKAGDETKIVPVLRWEVLDYLPYEVLDFPPEDR